MRTILRPFVSKDRRYRPISISNVSDLTPVKSLGNKTLDQQVLENRVGSLALSLSPWNYFWKDIREGVEFILLKMLKEVLEGILFS